VVKQFYQTQMLILLTEVRGIYISVNSSRVGTMVSSVFCCYDESEFMLEQFLVTCHHSVFISYRT